MTMCLLAKCGAYPRETPVWETGPVLEYGLAERHPLISYAALMVLCPVAMLAAVAASVTAVMLPVTLLMGWPI